MEQKNSQKQNSHIDRFAKIAQKQRELKKNKNKNKNDYRDSDYWQKMTELAYYFGIDAYLYAKHGILDAEEGTQLLNHLYKIRAIETVDNANASRASQAQKINDYKKALQGYTDRIRDI